MDIAKKISNKVEAEIEILSSNDPRSYRQDSTKLINTGFTPKYSVSDAIDEIIKCYKEGEIVDDDQCYTVKWMKSLGLEK